MSQRVAAQRRRENQGHDQRLRVHQEASVGGTVGGCGQ